MLLVHPCTKCCARYRCSSDRWCSGRRPAIRYGRLVGLAVIVGYGVARWFTTTYRIDVHELQLRTGVLQRKVLSVPRNRIRSVSTDARLLHRLLGLTVLRVSTGREAKGDAAFALDAVEAAQVPNLRAVLLSDSLAPRRRRRPCRAGNSRAGSRHGCATAR